MVQQFVADIEMAFRVWLTLIALAVAAVVLVNGPAWRQQIVRLWVRAAAGRLRRARVQTQTQLVHEEIRALTTSAHYTAVEAERHHARWVEANVATEEVWQAFTRVDTDARDALRALAYQLSDLDDDPAEMPAKHRVLRRLAITAHRRGDLSNEHLTDVLARRGEWRSGHLGDLEARLRLATRDHRWQQYCEAAAAERTAWRLAEAAREAERVAVQEMMQLVDAAGGWLTPLNQPLSHDTGTPRLRTGPSRWRTHPATS
jgi:hypothetical protein